MRRLGSTVESSTRGPIWSDAELDALEASRAAGLSTQEVVDLFAAKGAPVSEASFRKYVQLGLLPRSVRVGRKGKHRGSQGQYPATVVRQIESIRRLLAQGYTISELQRQLVLFGGEIDELAQKLDRVLDAVARAVAERGASGPEDMLTRSVSEARALSSDLLGRLRGIERSLAMRARMARAAV
jgi:DNA-binding transcriptional MerR regulator